MGGLTSAASFIALLDEDQYELKVYALEKLNALVDEFWAEIASDIQKM
jgi:26S proteasome regulatory subunit N2